jgi:hypothetical protein
MRRSSSPRAAATATLTATLLAGLALLAGCGMQAVDTQMRVRAEVGVPEEKALQVAEVEFVCPHVVPMNEREFNPQDVERGDVDGVFGPFVPCNTVVPAGTGVCPSCHQKYRTPGERADGDDPPPLASWKLACPYCHEAIDPCYVQTKGGDPHQPNRLALNQCPKCHKYYEVQPSDILTTLAGAVEETVCPACLKPIDPSLNACTNPSCRLGGVVRNVSDFEGPCWRCGGEGLCPECHGSGMGTLSLYGSTPSECWACGGSGRCEECGGEGFTTYTGALPSTYSQFQVMRGEATALESGQRKWQFPTPADDAPAEGAPAGDGN